MVEVVGGKRGGRDDVKRGIKVTNRRAKDIIVFLWVCAGVLKGEGEDVHDDEGRVRKKKMRAGKHIPSLHYLSPR
jgi:hypothetical protein